MITAHLGSSLDDFLEEEGLLAEAEAIAVKRLLALFKRREIMGIVKNEEVTIEELGLMMAGEKRTVVE